MYHSGVRAKCQTDGGPLQRRVRPHFLIGARPGAAATVTTRKSLLGLEGTGLLDEAEHGGHCGHRQRGADTKDLVAPVHWFQELRVACDAALRLCPGARGRTCGCLRTWLPCKVTLRWLRGPSGMPVQVRASECRGVTLP